MNFVKKIDGVDPNLVKFLTWRILNAYGAHKNSIFFILNSWEHIKQLNPILVSIDAEMELQTIYCNRADQLEGVE